MEKVLAIGAATARHRAPPAAAEVVEFPGTAERTGRTFMCTVLFLDIVEYSRKPVAEQLQVKERFNTAVSAALRDIPLEDRIVLDTGDGVAVNFLGDPEDAMFVALRLADAFAQADGSDPAIRVRAGINLGPVRLTRDINEQPNIVGDGINVAQRVMAFAQPGEVLVSRSYQEVVTRISQEYENLFAYQGSRTDKHVREHEIYRLDAARSGLRDIADQRARAFAGDAARAEAVPGKPSLLARRGLAVSVLVGSVLLLAAAVALHIIGRQPSNAPSRAEPGAALQAATAARVPTPPPAPLPDLAEAATPAAAPAASPQEEPRVAAVETAPAIQQQAPAAGKHGGSARPKPRAAAVRSHPQQPAPATAEPAGKETVQPAAPQPVEAPVTPWKPVANPEPVRAPEPQSGKGPQPGGAALVTFAISPWGEVVIDGKPVGVSPPLKEIELSKGRHHILVRNGEFKPYEEDVDLGSNATLKIKHKFKDPR